MESERPRWYTHPKPMLFFKTMDFWMPRLHELLRPDSSAQVGLCPEFVLSTDYCAFLGLWGCQGPAVRQSLNWLNVQAGLSSTVRQLVVPDGTGRWRRSEQGSRAGCPHVTLCQCGTRRNPRTLNLNLVFFVIKKTELSKQEVEYILFIHLLLPLSITFNYLFI